MEDSSIVASGWFDQWDMGTVPAWVGSLLTGLSLLVAAITFVRSRGDEKRAHASKLGAWISQEDNGIPGSFKYVLYVSNTSDVGAYEIEVMDEKTGDSLASISELPPKRVAQTELTRDKDSWKKRVRDMQIIRSPAGMVARVRIKDEPVVLEFRDALGRRWRIDSERNITSVKDSVGVKSIPGIFGFHTRDDEQNGEGGKAAPSSGAVQESSDKT